MHFWSTFGDSSLNGWQVIVRTSSKWDKFGLSSDIWPWRSRSIKPPNKRHLYRTKMHFWSTFGDSNLNGRQVFVWTSSKWGKIRLSSAISHLRSRSITPKNIKHRNQGVLYLWSKFGDSSLNGWWVIVQTDKWLIHIHTHGHNDRLTDAGDDNTRRPKLASGENGRYQQYMIGFALLRYALDDSNQFIIRIWLTQAQFQTVVWHITATFREISQPRVIWVDSSEMYLRPHLDSKPSPLLFLSMSKLHNNFFKQCRKLTRTAFTMTCNLWNMCPTFVWF